MKENIYVTGGRGFVGRHLCEKLDTFTSIPHHDIDYAEYEPFKWFFFLSTYGNMADHTNDSMITKANVTDVITTLNKLQHQERMGFESFVYMSSSSVKLDVQTMYSRTKKASEEILLAYREKHKLPIAIVRPFSITGVGEQPTHLIPRLIESCMTGKLINFVPEPVHDFIDVEDVVDGLITLARSKAHGIFELGTGITYTNQEVLELVEKATGKKAVVNYVPSMRPYDNTEWKSTNMKVRGFGWSPKKTLALSIKEMVEAYGK